LTGGSRLIPVTTFFPIPNNLPSHFPAKEPFLMIHDHPPQEELDLILRYYPESCGKEKKEKSVCKTENTGIDSSLWKRSFLSFNP
jgi:hypothetical protein